MLCDNLGDGREVQGGGDICIPVADSCWCMAETHRILQSNYSPIKKKIKNTLIPHDFSFEFKSFNSLFKGSLNNSNIQ